MQKNQIFTKTILVAQKENEEWNVSVVYVKYSCLRNFMIKKVQRNADTNVRFSNQKVDIRI